MESMFLHLKIYLIKLTFIADSYVPYKYALEKFITAGSITRDHTDPSIFCILTAKSKVPGIPLVDFCVLGPRWDVASHTFRLPVRSL